MSTFDHPEHTSSREPASEVDAHRDRVRTLLLERAASVHPNAAPVGQVVRRARRVRRRRTSVAIGAGLTAAAAMGATVIVVDRSANPSGDLELGVADVATEPSSAAPPTTAGGLVFHPVPEAASPVADGPPLRMGLDVPGASVISVSDTPEADLDLGQPITVGVNFRDASGSRTLSVIAAFDVTVQSPPGSPPNPTVLPMPTTSIVDVGDDGLGTLTRVPVPLADGSNASGVHLRIERGDDAVMIVATGLADDEVLAVGRGIALGPDWGLQLMSVPADLITGASPILPVGIGGGVRTQVVYRLPDGSEAVVDVISRPGDGFASERDQVAAAPTPEVFLTQVRGADAIVRRLPGFGPGGGETVTVTWLEPSNNLVTVRIEPAGAGVGDPGLVAAGIVELDEASFQAILADPGPS